MATLKIDRPKLTKAPTAQEIRDRARKDFDIGKVDPAIARGLNQAVKEVQVKIAAAPTQMKGVNGWVNPLSLGLVPTTVPGPP